MTDSLVRSSSSQATSRAQRATGPDGSTRCHGAKPANERRPPKRQTLLHNRRDDRSSTNRPSKHPSALQRFKRAATIASDAWPPFHTNISCTTASNDDGGCVAETDPHCTKYLWHRVMAGKNVTRSTVATRAKEKAAVGRHDSGIGSSDTRSKATSTDSGLKPAKITDGDFETLVLKPRGISIDSTTKSVIAFHHFDTPQPKDSTRSSHYHEIKGVETTTVWLDIDDGLARDIVREYNSMDKYRLCEPEYATYAIEKLLKREIRNPELPESREWMTERMLQMTQKLEENFWEQPPITDEAVPRRPYSFDVRPDCAYWISLQAFNPDYRLLVEEYVCVKQSRILCPYLTVEFKRDELSLARARYQVGVASALALYNRWQLKDRRLKATGKPWTRKRLRTLKHYGLTFTGARYEFWCIQPNFDDSSPSVWTGCRMSRVTQAACVSVQGVQTFTDWINEIHRWGLTIHGPACEKDVKVCIDQEAGAKRTSLEVVGGALEDSDSEEEEPPAAAA